jgi:hypothetical protein
MKLSVHSRMNFKVQALPQVLFLPSLTLLLLLLPGRQAGRRAGRQAGKQASRQAGRQADNHAASQTAAGESVRQTVRMSYARLPTFR